MPDYVSADNRSGQMKGINNARCPPPHTGPNHGGEHTNLET